jgi:LPXTG-motif cell wall-anchored protein
MAEEIIITGNGADSVNEANITTDNSTEVTQTNTAVVNNDIDVDADTGNNAANENTGDNVAIHTGDVNVAASVENNTNTSVVSVNNCCPTSGINAVISGNGTDSRNNIDYNSANTLNIDVNQVAYIDNNIDIDANTGHNSASGNVGDISIKTGNIWVDNEIANRTNYSKIKASRAGSLSALLKISGNGASSLNAILFNNENNTNISVNNIAKIDNDVNLDLNTGKNTANKNVGDVSIDSGDIDARVSIKNLANISVVDVTCGCVPEKEKEKKPEALHPTTTTSVPTTSSTAGVSAPADQLIAAAMGEILPSTGSNMFYLALIGNLMMLATGAYLKKRAGVKTGI